MDNTRLIIRCEEKKEDGYYDCHNYILLRINVQKEIH